MASVYKRKDKDGKFVSWRAVVRIKGYPVVCNHFDRKQEADDWANNIERQIKLGKYRFGQEQNQQKTLAELIDRYIEDGVIDHHKAAKDTLRQLNYFREQLGSYALVYITPDLLLQERKKLLNTPTHQGKHRKAATVNRYFSTLGGAFRYACKNLRRLDDNPCSNLLKLKAKLQKRRILMEDEEHRLLDACRQSKSPYLFCIVLLGITTGARKGEILGLTWNDIDFMNRVARIRDSKNGRPRYIGLVDSVIQELNRLYQKRTPSKPLIFASKTAFGKIDIKRSWNTALKQAGIKGFVFHCLRHHFCSLGGQMGASGTLLRAQMGHVSSSSTDTYSHHDAQATRFIGESIEKRILNRWGIHEAT